MPCGTSFTSNWSWFLVVSALPNDAGTGVYDRTDPRDSHHTVCVACHRRRQHFLVVGFHDDECCVRGDHRPSYHSTGINWRAISSSVCWVLQ